MSLSRRIMVLFIACAPALAQAEDMPAFLDDGVTFAKQAKFCPGRNADPEADDNWLLTAKGLFGYEIGCTTLQTLPERDAETDEIFGWQFAMQCGDDSGVTRPDRFSVLADAEGDALRLQSQNEYQITEMLLALNGAVSEDQEAYTSYLSGEYVRCPKP